MYRLYLLCGFLIIGLSAIAQNPYHKIFNIKDGLPSNEVHDLYVDSLNQIWITTDRGVCIYDGYKITTYTTKDGLAYNTNFRIIPDDYNRLWFTGFDGSLSYYENGKFHPYEFNDILRIKLDHNNWVNALHVNEKKELTIVKEIYSYGQPINNIIKIDSKGNINIDEINDKIIGTSEELNVNLYQHEILKPKFFSFKNLSLPILDYAEKDDTTVIVVNNIHFTSGPFKKHTKSDNSKVFSLGKNGSLMTLFETSSGINDIYYDSNNNLLICSSDGLFLINQDPTSKNKISSYFRGTEFTSVIQDKEGNYWVSSLNQGLYFIPSFEFDSHLAFGKEILTIESLNNNLVIGDSDKNIYALKKDDDSLIFKKRLNHSLIRFTKDSNLVFIDSKYSLEEDNNHELKFTKYSYDLEYTFNTEFIFLGRFNRKNGDVVLTKSGIRVLRNEEVIFSNVFKTEWDPDFEITSNIFVIKEDLKDQLFFAGIDGLFSPVNNNYERIEKINDEGNLLKTRIHDLIIDRYNNKWIASVGNGLLCMNENLEVDQFSTEHGLNSEIVQAIEFENDSTLWVGTNKGLDKITIRYNDETPTLVSVNNFDNSDGLPSNFINTLKIWDDKLWIGTTEGLVSFKTNYSPDLSFQPQIILDQVMVEKDSLLIQSGDSFDHDQNTILFSYRSVSYRKPKKDFYSYALTQNGEPENWIETDQTELRITNLPSASYTFKLKAKNKYGTWSQTKAVKFTIEKHFSQTWWFRILMGLLVIGLLYILYQRRIRKIRQEEKLVKSIEEAKLQTQIAELTTFRNQFNPHFIFNLLQSIQYSIVNNDSRQAVSSLSNFGKLMRMSLNLMKNKYVTLADELKFLRSYMELEFLRFPEKFEYKFEIGKDIEEEDFMLPPLLFQPAIENVLKHAFNDSKNGLLTISITRVRDSSAIKVQVIDNGSGMDLDPMKERDSFGLKLIRDRIKLLKIEYPETESYFKIYSNDLNKGTIAEIQIPIICKLKQAIQ